MLIVDCHPVVIRYRHSGSPSPPTGPLRTLDILFESFGCRTGVVSPLSKSFELICVGIVSDRNQLCGFEAAQVEKLIQLMIPILAPLCKEQLSELGHICGECRALPRDPANSPNSNFLIFRGASFSDPGGK